MKTILIVFWILVFLGGLIAVIVSLSKRGGHNIEDKQDYNMFKGKNCSGFNISKLLKFDQNADDFYSQGTSRNTADGHS